MAMVHLSILIEPTDLEALDRISAKLGLTRSDVVRNMVRESIPAYGRTAKMIHNPMISKVLKMLMAGDPEAQLTLENLYSELSPEQA